MTSGQRQPIDQFLKQKVFLHEMELKAAAEGRGLSGISASKASDQLRQLEQLMQRGMSVDDMRYIWKYKEIPWPPPGSNLQPMPRPAPGTRVKSTGPGVRKLTDAEKELMQRAAGRGASESAERMAPARVPQGGLETRGRPGGRHGSRANWEAEEQLARLERYWNKRATQLEAAESAEKVVPSAAKTPKPWSDFPGKLTGTNLEQDVMDILMTQRHTFDAPWDYSPINLSRIIERNTGVEVGEGRIRATLKDLEVRGLVEPAATGKRLSSMDESIRADIANPDFPHTGARYKKSMPDWANPEAGRERVYLGTYRLRQPKTYFGSE